MTTARSNHAKPQRFGGTGGPRPDGAIRLTDKHRCLTATPGLVYHSATGFWPLDSPPGQHTTPITLAKKTTYLFFRGQVCWTVNKGREGERLPPGDLVWEGWGVNASGIRLAPVGAIALLRENKVSLPCT